ncbi:MAG: enoyl-CoA hydratase/isomerase family protein [Anaerovoracaceae bacterium]|jgi:enoyl-CoA hydratase
MKEVLYEKRGHTALITFNKPSTLNALCTEFMQEIDEAIEQAQVDPDVYVLIFTGSGKAFIAGADISEMYPQDSNSIREWAKLGCNQNLRIENLPFPTIAAINGYALGGGLELAMSCDIRLASEKAVMGQPETTLGVICGAGGTQRLPKLVGRGMASELIFTGGRIDAEEALRIGLVNHVTRPEDLLDQAFALAEKIEKNGQLAVRTAKQAIRQSERSVIEDGCDFERAVFCHLFDTEDQKIGMGGFLRKEKNIQFKNK